MTTNDVPPQLVQQLIQSLQMTQCLYVATKLGIADLLKDGPQSHEDLAKASGIGSEGGQRWQQDAGSPAHGAAPEKDPPMHQLSEHAERLAHYPSPKTGRSIRFESQPVARVGQMIGHMTERQEVLCPHRTN
jgi:hypothetical protein